MHKEKQAFFKRNLGILSFSKTNILVNSKREYKKHILVLLHYYLVLKIIKMRQMDK